MTTYRAIGFKSAIDYFGAGYAGLNLLAKFQPDIVKLGMELIRDIVTDGPKQIVVCHIVHMLEELGVTAICEGVETEGELQTLQQLGADFIQGYVIAKPLFEALPDAVFDR